MELQPKMFQTDFIFILFWYEAIKCLPLATNGMKMEMEYDIVILNVMFCCFHNSVE